MSEVGIIHFFIEFFLHIKFRQLGQVVMSIDLLFVDDAATHRLLGDGTRIDLFLHSAHGQQTIDVADLFLSQAKNAENILFWKMQKQKNEISNFQKPFDSLPICTHDHSMDSTMCPEESLDWRRSN